MSELGVTTEQYRQCSSCLQVLPLDNNSFYFNKNVYHYRCKVCTNHRLSKLKKNPRCYLCAIKLLRFRKYCDDCKPKRVKRKLPNIETVSVLKRGHTIKQVFFEQVNEQFIHTHLYTYLRLFL